ncbi:MAG: hypothetical protein K8R77_10470 [Anaerolineaceae bacterium]|nr:hypothetical protein [Anaerolineaceae bacterium]
MSRPKTASSVVLGNRIQSAIAQAVQEHNRGQVTSALIVVVDKETEEVQEMTIVSEEKLTDIVLMYEDKIK